MVKVFKQNVSNATHEEGALVPGKALHVGIQDNDFRVWYLTDGSTETIFVRGTGQNLPDNVEFINTFFVREFVFHAFRASPEDA